ncbi:MAG: serine/threonine-protein phosphatase [Polyangiaceae bacterium]|nr:serine/threonine-protein phosphatase [Polyangiaceae bacterium]
MLYLVAGAVALGLGLLLAVAVVMRRRARRAPGPAVAPVPGPAVPAVPAPAVPAPSAPAPRVATPAAARPARRPSGIDDDDEPSGPQALILVTAVARTDPGLKRKHNEDAYGVLADHHVFLIADGMGRHAAGEVASQLCVETVTECFRTGKFGEARPDPTLPRRGNRLRAAILEANGRILRAAELKDAYHGMGTTVVALCFSPSHQRVSIAHVGDSRCYRYRGAKLEQLTTDHTLGAIGVVGKTAGVLSRAVGIEEELDVDVTTEAPLPGDIYLLCSDGLSRMVPDEEVGAVLGEHGTDLERATKRLIDLANERGGRDNVTAILVRVDATGRPQQVP